MINIKDGRVCIKCGLSKKWEFYYEKPKSKFGYQSSCRKCVNAEQSIRRSIAKLAEPSNTPVSNIGISPFRFIAPKEPEKIVELRTKRWPEEKINNYWENSKKF